MLRVLFALLCFLAGAAAVFGGVAVLAFEQRVQDITADARGEIPGSVSFQADARKYNVLLGFGTNSSIAVDARCEARLADGSVRRMRGDRQGVAVRGVASTIGAFTAVAGPTTVQCGWADAGEDREVKFSVAKVRTTLRVVAFVAVGAGLLIIGLGLLVLLRRRRGPSAPLPPPGGPPRFVSAG